MSAHESLSRGQLGHLLDSGAFSVRAYGQGVGDRAKNGYVVALGEHGADYSPTASVDDAASFVQNRKDVLQQPNRYFGGYQGTEPPRMALDVSRLHEPTISGHMAAAHEAMSTNQESYGHLGSDPTDYTDFPNKYYDPQGGHGHRAVSMEQMGWAVEQGHALHPNEGVSQPSRSSELTAPSKVPRR